jgi:phosphoglycerate-specific signal transduction histidine kinase
MKRSVMLVLCGLFALALGVNATFARPDYSKHFQEKYKDAKIAAAAKEAKCTVCHYGNTKKNRNDFGTALSKTLTEEGYKELKEDKEALNKKIKEALKAVLKEKSVSGKTFGELVEAGQLPGTAPAEK